MTARRDDDGRRADDDQPFEAAMSQHQIDALLDYLGSEPKRILEIGCGAGRVLVPLASAGHHCEGIDNDPGALRDCESALRGVGATAQLHTGDFLEPWPGELQSPPDLFDAIVCLGNTFMTVHDVDRAVALLRQCVSVLSPGGVIVLDDLAAEHWPELAEGNWQSGVSGDGRTQLVWAADDAVFALRRGDRVDLQNWELCADDHRLRLWTAGALRLAAGAAGLSGPCRLEGSGLLVLGR